MNKSKYDLTLAAIVVAVASYLGHRWARYIGGTWPSFVEVVGRGLEGAALLAALPDNPFYLKGMSAREATGLANLIREAAQKDFLDLVLEGDTIAELTRHTYMKDDIPGINSPGVKVGQYGCVWHHTTATGRGSFTIESAPGRLTFGFRVTRGGNFKGLTALEVIVELLGDEVTANYSVTHLAEERHIEFATDTLLGVSGELLRGWYSTEKAKLIASKMASTALSITGFGEV